MENRTLGTFIAFLRKEKGLTQKQLAELLNVSDKTVSHWECDETSPDISLLPILAQTLGVTVDELLQGEKRVIQPTVEHHYIPPKNESFSDKASGFASRTLNKIKGKMTGDVAERYRYFRILSLIGTVIACVVLLSITFTNLITGYYFSLEMAIIPGIIAFIGSLWTLAISLGFTLGARLAFYKDTLPSPEATEEEQRYIFKANAVCFNNIFLVFCAFPMSLTAIDALDISVVLNVPVAVTALAVLWLVLTVKLNKKGILRTDKKKLLGIKYLSIFALSAIIIGGSLWFFAKEIWHPKTEIITFNNTEEFVEYMETPRGKPADADIIDGVTATILISDGVIIDENTEGYIRSEEITVKGQTISFKWLNEAVFDYSCDSDEGIFYVITYEAKLNQKDQEILVDDGVPIVVVMFCVVDALVCFVCYRKKVKELTQA